MTNRQDAFARRWTRRVLASGVVAAVLASGVAFAAQPPAHWGRGPVDLKTAQERAVERSSKLLREAGASQEQQDKVAGIVKAAVQDMHPLREKSRSLREESRKLLSAPAIDRAAVEKLRAEQSAVHEQMSKRMTAAMLDSADVLTPEQRAKVAAKMAEHRGGKGRPGQHKPKSQ
jgi:periplasmic protein CpxP/Spy